MLLNSQVYSEKLHLIFDLGRSERAIKPSNVSSIRSFRKDVMNTTENDFDLDMVVHNQTATKLSITEMSNSSKSLLHNIFYTISRRRETCIQTEINHSGNNSIILILSKVQTRRISYCRSSVESFAEAAGNIRTGVRTEDLGYQTIDNIINIILTSDTVEEEVTTESKFSFIDLMKYMFSLYFLDI